MGSEQGDQLSLPGGIEEWLTDQTAATGENRERVLARAVAAYRLLTEQGDEDEPLESTLSELESRIDELEADAASSAGSADAADTTSQRLDELEAELESHVEDLRSRIVDVVKEARSRAPSDHSHDALDDRLDELAGDTDQLTDRLADTESTTETLEETATTLESKADRLASAVVDLRRRLERMESHASHQQALARLLATAAHKDVTKADCENCGKTVQLGLLIEPACPHCRSVFDGIEAGDWFFTKAVLRVADRPALEAGETTDRPFSADGEQTREEDPV